MTAGLAPAVSFPLAMLADLDALMKSRGIDTVIVPMHEAPHAAFRWLTRGAKVTRGYAVKRAGRAPLLVSYPMEREEAAATGLKTRLIHDFGYDEIFRTAAHPVEAYAVFFDRVLRELGSGTAIEFVGNIPFHLYYGIAEAMQQRGWRVHRGEGEDLVQLARKRKEPWEIEMIASVGARTEAVVDRVRRILRLAVVEETHLLHQGEVLTLGYLKQVVSSEIARLGMIEDHETILSQGRDAGIPHSRGDAAAVVRPSVPIVLDIFPSDRDSGYFFDLTRTFCAGPIPDELQHLHADVLAAYQLAAEEMRAGTSAKTYQEMVCDFFEARGYATTRSDPQTLNGYVHSLGHGVGLDVHEKPFFGLSAANTDQIEVGDVVTIEPGLYFPDRHLGVRIEDTLVVRDDGRVESLSRSDRGLAP
ncbi:MAG TPA: M24 family metallopeptidase [Thermoanaerobaculia bacterium]|nr:M24 family metallopeptidase [Thermoanaerobaculia bacterium]